jgi:hypothetical protein
MGYWQLPPVMAQALHNAAHNPASSSSSLQSMPTHAFEAPLHARLMQSSSSTHSSPGFLEKRSGAHSVGQ